MNKQTFKTEIERQLDHARQTGRTSLTLSAGDVHRDVGAYPGPGHAMPTCCAALRDVAEALQAELVHSPPKGNGASLAFRFTI